MEIKQIELSQIKAYPNNPRNNDIAVDKVVASIKEFGFKVPVIIDKNYEIVAGHTRVKAATKMGMTQVPCIIADDLTEDQIKAFRLVENKSQEWAEWNIELLELELGDIQLDMSAFGFEDGTADGEPQEDDYNVMIDESEPRTIPGELFELGGHRLLCGDATVAADYDRLMGGGIADLVVADPPYNVDYEGTAGKIQNDKMDDSAFATFLGLSFHNMSEHLKHGGAFYIFHSDSEGENFRRETREHLGKVRQCLIWNKNSFVMGRQDYHWKHEPCLYGWKDGAAHYFVDDRTQSTVIEDKGIDLKKIKKDEAIALLKEIYSDKTSTTVLNEDKPARNDLHPTTKPIKLLARLIKNSSRMGEIVLDPFLGSGSTLIACEQLGRKCYGIELDCKFADVIIDRWEKFTGKKAVKIRG